jgi:hypothetical protein
MTCPHVSLEIFALAELFTFTKPWCVNERDACMGVKHEAGSKQDSVPECSHRECGARCDGRIES